MNHSLYTLVYSMHGHLHVYYSESTVYYSISLYIIMTIRAKHITVHRDRFVVAYCLLKGYHFALHSNFVHIYLQHTL